MRTNVEFIVSDPWDFVTQCGSGPFSGVILKTGVDQQGDPLFLLALDNAISYDAVRCDYAVLSSRHQGKPLSEIETGLTVPCNFTCVSRDDAMSTDPFHVPFKRTSLALVGSLRTV